jgi:DNA helicase-2/ATP-dependent DNA helicase PcrA
MSEENGNKSPFSGLEDLFNLISGQPGPSRSPEGLSLRELIENADFEEIILDDETQLRIKELQLIAESIEQKVTNEKFPVTEKTFKINYRKDLNPQQLSAALIIDAPLLVIAGAGSGKTRVITYKVSYLIEKGIQPEEILLLTFTRKASQEMLRRVDQLLGGNYSGNVMGGTFHSFANHILRKYANMVGIPNNFTIIDTQDAADIVDLIKSEMTLPKKKKGKAFPRKSRIYTIISKSRNIGISISEVIEKYFDGLIEFTDELEAIGKAFEKYKSLANLFDYDDLMEVLRDKLRDNKKFRESLQSKIKYLLVDEFQDTNDVQNEIVTLIAGDRNCVTVVGDDTQSIYSFRGANFENILRFPQRYPHCKVVKIEENYRSSENILNLTNSIVDNSILGFKKKLTSQRPRGAFPVVKKFGDAQLEAEFTVDKILELRKNNLTFSDVSILSRASWHSNYIQAELTKRSIPYIVVGGIKFIERRHVKDVMAFLRLGVNQLDAISWHRILRLINGVGQVRSRELITEILKNQGRVDFSAFQGKKFYPGLHQLETVVSKLAEGNHTPASSVNLVLEYYGPILKMVEDDYQNRLKDLAVILQIASKYENLEKFLSEFALEPPSNRFQDKVTPMIDQSEDGSVTVSTIHSAKGLEWHTVFIPFALDGLFPSSRSLGTIDEIEEERRLFYVACSRPKEQLFITMPSYVSQWDSYFTKPSRFISGLKEGAYEVEE